MHRRFEAAFVFLKIPVVHYGLFLYPNFIDMDNLPNPFSEHRSRTMDRFCMAEKKKSQRENVQFIRAAGGKTAKGQSYQQRLRRKRSHQKPGTLGRRRVPHCGGGWRESSRRIPITLRNRAFRQLTPSSRGHLRRQLKRRESGRRGRQRQSQQKPARRRRRR